MAAKKTAQRAPGLGMGKSATAPKRGSKTTSGAAPKGGRKTRGELTQGSSAGRDRKLARTNAMKNRTRKQKAALRAQNRRSAAFAGNSLVAQLEKSARATTTHFTKTPPRPTSPFPAFGAKKAGTKGG